MQVNRIGVDESVSTIFAPAKLVDALSAAPVSVTTVESDAAALARTPRPS